MYTLGIYFFFVRNNYFKTPIENFKQNWGQFSWIGTNTVFEHFQRFHQKCYSNEPPTRLNFCCNGHVNCEDMYMLTTVILWKCTLFPSLDDILLLFHSHKQIKCNGTNVLNFKKVGCMVFFQKFSIISILGLMYHKCTVENRNSCICHLYNVSIFYGYKIV